MTFSAVAYTVFTLTLAAVFTGILIYYYNPKRKKEIEKPKHRMLDEDE
ncbi:MAG: cbb3-type cytochrome c oxidase subunit 3 [Chlorobiaceae bacterium]|nr:cbb3-type cytochrome c oxidase subunit 3 [Chlorobiaceae bacterium]